MLPFTYTEWDNTCYDIREHMSSYMKLNTVWEGLTERQAVLTLKSSAFNQRRIQYSVFVTHRGSGSGVNVNATMWSTPWTEVTCQRQVHNVVDAVNQDHVSTSRSRGGQHRGQRSRVNVKVTMWSMPWTEIMYQRQGHNVINAADRDHVSKTWTEVMYQRRG